MSDMTLVDKIGRASTSASRGKKGKAKRPIELNNVPSRGRQLDLN